MNDINDQETFSGMAPILGLSAMHERRREQFAFIIGGPTRT
jgi:hypothetical protein